jgi:hypothetical protein
MLRLFEACLMPLPFRMNHPTSGKRLRSMVLVLP